MTDTLPLETLNQKLERLIANWKRVAEVQDNAGEWNAVNAELATFVAVHPELLHTQPSIPELVNAIEQAVPAYYSPDGLEGALIPQLLALPDEIRRLQAAFDEVDRDYQALVAINNLEALSNNLFKDKGNATRPANNEREREIAINYAVLGNHVIEEVWKRRADALRALTQAKNRLECARLVIQLVCNGKR